MIYRFKNLCNNISVSHIPVTKNSIDTILALHGLAVDTFEEKIVYDLGCGESDLGADLALRGINSYCIGFDQSPRALIQQAQTKSTTRRVYAKLTDLPVEPESADIAIATFSSPFWDETVEQIHQFYNEAERVVRFGGILAVYPVAVHLDYHNLKGEDSYGERFSAAKEGALAIRKSPCWENIGLSDNYSKALTVRKIQ